MIRLLQSTIIILKSVQRLWRINSGFDLSLLFTCMSSFLFITEMKLLNRNINATLFFLFLSDLKNLKSSKTKVRSRFWKCKKEKEQNFVSTKYYRNKVFVLRYVPLESVQINSKMWSLITQSSVWLQDCPPEIFFPTEHWMVISAPGAVSSVCCAGGQCLVWPSFGSCSETKWTFGSWAKAELRHQERLVYGVTWILTTDIAFSGPITRYRLLKRKEAIFCNFTLPLHYIYVADSDFSLFIGC